MARRYRFGGTLADWTFTYSGNTLVRAAGINLAPVTGNPDGWYLHELTIHDCGGAGLWWGYAVDGQLDVFHFDHNLSGLALGTMNNTTIGHGKCQQNTQYGYTTTGGFVKSNATLAHCFAENNLLDDFHFDITAGGGQGSLQLIGCSSRDCGMAGASGSGYSSFWINSKNVDVTLAGCSNYVTTATAGPDYGLTLAGCLGNVAVLGGSYGGSVAAYRDGGSNTGIIAFGRVTQWTGQAGARTGVTMVSAGPAVATGARPAAASVGEGTQFYDTTLNKPIWSDGATWRDAAGTAV